MLSRALSAALLLGLVSASPAMAQGQPQADLRPVAERLRSLERAEEEYYNVYNFFTQDLTSLRLPAEDDVRLQVLYAGGAGWVAIGWRETRPNRQCVIFSGDRADLPEVPGTTDGTAALHPGQPACDDTR
jgi:hypothetical protein